jgi:hypothetical protein
VIGEGRRRERRIRSCDCTRDRRGLELLAYFGNVD